MSLLGIARKVKISQSSMTIISDVATIDEIREGIAQLERELSQNRNMILRSWKRSRRIAAEGFRVR